MNALNLFYFILLWYLLLEHRSERHFKTGGRISYDVVVGNEYQDMPIIRRLKGVCAIGI